MPTQDTSKLKERIVQVLRMRGPNFPSPIASEIQTSILFTSAFLSELLSEKQVKITNMKVGSSPIYYIPGQEEKLEEFAIKFLKSKEKEAFMLLSEKKFLKDSEQEPAIRVALRSIKDFAFPEEKNSELYWKYFIGTSIIPEKETVEIEAVKEEVKIFENQSENKETVEKEESNEEKIIIPIKKGILEKKSKTKSVKKTVKKKTVKKQDEKFFNKTKEYLLEKNIEILDIIGFNKTELFLKVQEGEERYLIIAHNKRKISEKEVIDSHKKASELGLKYSILSFGEPSKKLSQLLEAAKEIKEINKMF